MPRVSILLTCYNHLPYLRPCLEALRRQTFKDFEVIALDDGSTDGTREWLADQSDPWLTCVFNERNLGTYGALNEGLRRAEGEFVAVLNDDDLWEPEKLARQIELMDARPEVGLVHTNGRFINGSGEFFEGEPLGFAFPRTEAGDVLEALVYANKIIASAALFRRSLIDELGGFNEAYFGSGDWEMWLRIAVVSQVGYVDERLTHYRVHGANASHKLDRIWRDDEKLRAWIAERLLDWRGRGWPEGAWERAAAHNWACLGTVRTLNGSPGLGREAYAESLRLRPGRWQSRARWLATWLPRPAFRALLRA
jgi:glycosyltransferase involved in cell wall biosynthesis